ncbi:hypothetical protein HK145_01025 [Streptococcus agalactiae]|nr:hypothetical protein [Streptococcus agalactiae]
MRAWKGIVLILSSIVVTLVAWQNAGLSEFVVPGLALTSLSLTFLLSTKFRILESYFQGIENMYFYHKVMAVFSMILLLLHKIVVLDKADMEVSLQRLLAVRDYIFF